ncbi:MAG: S9 family peptidase [Proteobacteria bacterium]|nr:S9 family peptidase [Pseudomonadota bacterium]
MRLVKQAAQAASFAAILLSFAALPAFSAPPVEAFGKLPFISGLSISPDGKHFSSIQAVNGRASAVVYPVDAQPNVPPKICELTDGIATGSVWVNNDRVICILSGAFNYHGFSPRYYEIARAVSVSVSGQPAQILMKGSIVYSYNSGTHRIDGLNLDDPNVVYLNAYYATVDTQQNTHLNRVEWVPTLYKVDINSGHGSTYEAGNRDTVQFVMDGHGNVVGRLDEITRELKDHLFIKESGSWNDAATFDASHGWEAHVYGLTANGNNLVIGRYGDNQILGLDSFNLKTKAFDAPLFRDGTYDAFPLYDEWTGRVIGAGYVSDMTHYVWFDPARQKIQKSLEAAVPGQAVRIISVDKAGATYLAESDGPKDPPTYYVYRPATQQMAILATEYPNLQSSDLGDVKRYDYSARDGLNIPAYLTLPPGKSGKNLPTVILPHGGPQGRDDLGFDWLSQFLTTRGYAVLRPNFRGSAGYGYKFQSAGYGEWGRKMQDDVSDGVKKLIADGIADPKRICIVGWDYGGYAALAGVTFTPELYACGVSLAGVGNVEDLVTRETSDEERDSSFVKYLNLTIGSNETDQVKLREVSPSLHPENVRAPVLLLHADKDMNVTIRQSEAEDVALRNAGRHVEFVHLDGDDHDLQVEQTRLMFAKEIERFLATYIGN